MRSLAQSPPPMTFPARAGHLDAVPIERGGREEGAAIGGHNDLGRPLAGAVGVETAQRVDLAVAPHLFSVLVTLIAADHDHRAGLAHGPNRLQHPDCSQDVYIERLAGTLVAFPHQRLGGQVEDHLRASPGDGLVQRGLIADVRLVVTRQ